MKRNFVPESQRKANGTHHQRKNRIGVFQLRLPGHIYFSGASPDDWLGLFTLNSPADSTAAIEQKKKKKGVKA